MGLIFSTRKDKNEDNSVNEINKTTIYSTITSPKALGHYSTAIKSGNLLFCSGQIGVNPETEKLVEGGIEFETKQACRNISSVLKENGTGLKNVVKTTIFLKNMNDFNIVNKIYKNYFILKPARSTVEIKSLPMGAQIEIEAIAQID